MFDASKIKPLRESLGLTLEAAATKAGFVNRQHWWRIESGNVPDPRVSTLVTIAAVLGISPLELLKLPKSLTTPTARASAGANTRKRKR